MSSPGTEQDIVPRGPRFQAHQVTVPLGCSQVPRCSQRDGSRRRRRLSLVGRLACSYQWRIPAGPSAMASTGMPSRAFGIPVLLFFIKHIDLLFQGHLREQERRPVSSGDNDVFHPRPIVC